MKKANQALLSAIFGSEAQTMVEEAVAVDPDVAVLIEEIPLERIWSRPGLPLREKSLVTLASQIALERWEQVELHMRSFLHIGGTARELREICFQLSVYCGFPVMIRAIRIAHDVIEAVSGANSRPISEER
jgi:4-carboxymuconolactone decarboxylase